MKEQLKNMFTWDNFFTFSGRATGFQFLVAGFSWGVISICWYLFFILSSLTLLGKVEIDVNIYDSIPKLASLMPTWATIVLLIPIGLITALSLLSMLSFTVRRFHDMNLSGWWSCSWIPIQLICKLPILKMVSNDPVSSFLLAFLVFPGTRGHNRFGNEVGADDLDLDSCTLSDGD